MTTPNPKGYPSSNAMLDRLRNSIREKPAHWSYDETQRTRAKRATKAQKTLSALLSA